MLQRWLRVGEIGNSNRTKQTFLTKLTLYLSNAKLEKNKKPIYVLSRVSAGPDSPSGAVGDLPLTIEI